MSGVLALDDGTELAIDDRGYLLDPSQWRAEVAETMAGADGVTLEPAHWQVLEETRRYFDEHGIEPPMRALVMRLRKRTGDTTLGSRELYRLFPDGPGLQGVRYAGLPRPVSCI
ncbi:TusE/DsrC/DsvC family sulfur relay protein [Marinihelvus fidelis]|uniref:Sulfurtransferase n=1 Tax=Marinihelvus fidelis TaxID=2613842 RepID=A0A5N0T963_9GAMM|nr:TusE/DsrC/DsvC family sulfur relay protein [Marinihelvus fidelis]KAA9129839.1 TusE/DsrC/DsvC family sulfur relay protein [Marinihelvus fidelis]